jgi:hypothetical protein
MARAHVDGTKDVDARQSDDGLSPDGRNDSVTIGASVSRWDSIRRSHRLRHLGTHGLRPIDIEAAADESAPN